jgi:hypothetical protein
MKHKASVLAEITFFLFRFAALTFLLREKRLTPLCRYMSDAVPFPSLEVICGTTLEMTCWSALFFVP